MAGEAIFIGYRRDDTADVAGRIYDAMAQRFGKTRIFKDVDNIGPGVDFGDYIKGVLPRCRVALVLIGPHWLESKDDTGQRRIDDEHDWVRVEIETALATPGLLVVPVLVNGARMPRSDEVPDNIRPLLRRNAAIIRRDPDFHDDVERLASAIRASVNTGVFDFSKIGERKAASGQTAKAKSNATPMFAALLLGALAIIALFIWQPWRTAPANTADVGSTPTAAAAPPSKDAPPATAEPAPPEIYSKESAAIAARSPNADGSPRECRQVNQLVVRNGVETNEPITMCLDPATHSWSVAN